MLGTIRTLDNSMRATVLKRLDEIVQNVAAANNVKAYVTFMNSYPVTYNDPELYEKMLPTLKRVCGADNVNYMDAITGAEDFSFFQKEVPGVYFFIGGSSEGMDLDMVAPHHTPDFYVPFFTTFEIFAYYGWIKVAETLLNPFGDDDTDFQVNYLIDRNLQVKATKYTVCPHTFSILE